MFQVLICLLAQEKTIKHLSDNLLTALASHALGPEAILSDVVKYCTLNRILV